MVSIGGGGELSGYLYVTACGGYMTGQVGRGSSKWPLRSFQRVNMLPKIHDLSREHLTFYSLRIQCLCKAYSFCKFDEFATEEVE